jgi:excisionase family DNA binding protein
MKNYDLTPQQLENIYIKPVLSVEEASIFLGVSFKHLHNLVKSNKIVFFRSGKRKLIRRSDLEKYIDDNISVSQ